MATLERIERYRDLRPSSLLTDDMIAWELDHAPDCAADVPAEFKAELERLADDGPGIGFAVMAVAATAPLALYDYASAPHGGRWKPLPDHGHEPAIKPTVHIHHSIVGSGAGAWSYFANSSSLESTNIVLKSGELWQCMSRREQADANYRANDFAISTETEDDGDPNTDPWTPQQMDTLVWVTLEDIRDFGIPRRVCPAWDAGGAGYHSMFGAPSQWTPATGKTCPGTVRIRQWHEVVVPRILGTLTEQGDLMADAQDILDKLDAVSKLIRVGDTAGGPTDTHDYASLEGVGRQVKDLDGLLRIAIWGSVRGATDTHDETLSIEGVNRRLDTLEDKVDDILAALTGPPPEPPA